MKNWALCSKQFLDKFIVECTLAIILEESSRDVMTPLTKMGTVKGILSGVLWVIPSKPWFRVRKRVTSFYVTGKAGNSLAAVYRSTCSVVFANVRRFILDYCRLKVRFSWGESWEERRSHSSAIQTLRFVNANTLCVQTVSLSILVFTVLYIRSCDFC